jgi:hypothetical protein
MIGAVARRVSQQGATPRRTIPFDYQFRFALTDTDPEKSYVDQLFRQTITVSIEAAFTATSISYALLPSESARVLFGPGQPQDFESVPKRTATSPRKLLLWDFVNSLGRKLDESSLRTEVGPRTAAVLANGIRLNPRLAQRVLLNGGNDDLTSDELDELFEAMTVPSGPIQFLYGLFDEGTGREFQSELLLNTAGLGKDDGDRPFRNFASPVTFATRTTIRLDMMPKSEFKGELYVVLHGYKTLGTPGTPTGRRRSPR